MPSYVLIHWRQDGVRVFFFSFFVVYSYMLVIWHLPDPFHAFLCARAFFGIKTRARVVFYFSFFVYIQTETAVDCSFATRLCTSSSAVA